MSNTEDRINNLELRLRKIELRLGSENEPTSESQKLTETIITTNFSASTTSPVPMNPPIAKSSTSNTVIDRATDRVYVTKPLEPESGRWLGFVGIVCFVFAAIYIIKLAIDSGWLTPVRQIAMSGSLGAILISLGLKFRSKDTEYISYLPAGGVTILFLTWIGASNFHKLMSPDLALVGTLLTGTLCLFLYSKFQSAIYQAIAILGTFVGPFFIGSSLDFNFINSYFVIASITFSTLAVWMDSRPITLMSAYLAVACTSLSGFGNDLVEPKMVYTFIHFIIYLTGILTHTYSLKMPLTRTEAQGFFPLLLFFYAIEYFYFDTINPSMAPYFSLAIAGLLIGVYFLSKKLISKPNSLESGDILFSAALIITVHSLYFVLADEAYRPALFLVLAGIAYKILLSNSERRPIFSSISRIIVIGLLAWNLFLIPIQQFKSTPEFWIGYGFLYSVLMLFYYSQSRARRDSISSLILVCAHGLSIVSLYNLTKDFGSLAVSFSWSIYALLIMGYGYARRDSEFAQSSVIVLMFAAAKVLLWDTSQASALVRVLCLLFTGALLYFSGLVFRKINAWK